MKSLAVGIDFGTSNSGVALYDGHELKLLPMDPDNVMPEVIKSVQYITRENEVYIGQQALKIHYAQNVGRRVTLKRVWVGEIDVAMSDMFFVRDVYADVDMQQPGRLLQFLKMALRFPNYEGTQVFEEFYTPEMLVATYLRLLKQKAEAILGQEIDTVVLGRPVRFVDDDPESDARAECILLDAAHAAGFALVELELEPVAAAYYYEKSITEPQSVLVFDFGGGTLDITVMQVGGGQNRRILSTGGIGIAGTDFDKAIISKKILGHLGKGATYREQDKQHRLPEEFFDRISDWYTLASLGTPGNQALLEKAQARSRYPTRIRALESVIFEGYGFMVYNQVEEAKIRLSEQGHAVIRISENNIHIWQLITRFQFEEMITAEAARIHHCLLDTLSRSGLEAGHIDAVVRTGGSSRIPFFIEMLNQVFGKEKVRSVNDFSSVAAGLAIRAYEKFSE